MELESGSQGRNRTSDTRISVRRRAQFGASKPKRRDEFLRCRPNSRADRACSEPRARSPTEPRSKFKKRKDVRASRPNVYRTAHRTKPHILAGCRRDQYQPRFTWACNRGFFIETLSDRASAGPADSPTPATGCEHSPLEATMNKLLLLLLAVGAASTARAEPVDLLDFDKALSLVSATPSYGSGVSNWAPFGLSDAAASRMVLCAGPTGTSRVRLRTGTGRRATDATHREHGCAGGRYPGISARTVSLWAAGASGSYEKIGTFEAPKGGEKEFPCPRPVQFVASKSWSKATGAMRIHRDHGDRSVRPEGWIHAEERRQRRVYHRSGRVCA